MSLLLNKMSKMSRARLITSRHANPANMARLIDSVVSEFVGPFFTEDHLVYGGSTTRVSVRF